MTETRGKDFNYFTTVSITGVLAFSESPQAQAVLRGGGAKKMMLRCVSGTNVEYSFNGTTVHGRISANETFNFGTRAEDKIWFRGTGEVDVHIWHIGV